MQKIIFKVKHYEEIKCKLQERKMYTLKQSIAYKAVFGKRCRLQNIYLVK